MKPDEPVYYPYEQSDETVVIDLSSSTNGIVTKPEVIFDEPVYETITGVPRPIVEPFKAPPHMVYMSDSAGILSENNTIDMPGEVYKNVSDDKTMIYVLLAISIAVSGAFVGYCYFYKNDKKD